MDKTDILSDKTHVHREMSGDTSKHGSKQMSELQEQNPIDVLEKAETRGSKEAEMIQEGHGAIEVSGETSMCGSKEASGSRGTSGKSQELSEKQEHHGLRLRPLHKSSALVQIPNGKKQSVMQTNLNYLSP